MANPSKNLCEQVWYDVMLNNENRLLQSMSSSVSISGDKSGIFEPGDLIPVHRGSLEQNNYPTFVFCEIRTVVKLNPHVHNYVLYVAPIDGNYEARNFMDNSGSDGWLRR